MSTDAQLGDDARRHPAPAARASDVICFAGQDWWYHNRAHSDFQLMTNIARERRVLLVNSIGMRMPTPGKSTLAFSRIKRKLDSLSRRASEPVVDLPGFTVMSPIMLPFYGSAAARAASARLVRMQVERVAKSRGLSDPHIVVTVPTAWDVAEKMQAASVIYNRSDNHSAFVEADGGVIRSLEQRLMDNADGVIYSSRTFMEEERARIAGAVRFVDHGVDLEHFAPRERGRELDGIPRPIIGFFGGFDDYVIDFDLLEQIATDMPDASLVLIGGTTLPLDRLTRHPNVHYLGQKPYADIPALGAEFDVAIMPWQDNEWIRHCNPIKLKEYLALGLPVVTTWYPEVEFYEDYVHVARKAPEFISVLRDVLAGTAEEKSDARAGVLRGARWSDRAHDLLELMDELARERRA